LDEWYKYCVPKGFNISVIHLYKTPYAGCSVYALRLDLFPGKEYDLMYGKKARHYFDTLSEAQDHVDSFLVKLEKLIAFL
jgi:hypothetical protein